MGLILKNEIGTKNGTVNDSYLNIDRVEYKRNEYMAIEICLYTGNSLENPELGKIDRCENTIPRKIVIDLYDSENSSLLEEKSLLEFSYEKVKEKLKSLEIETEDDLEKRYPKVLDPIIDPMTGLEYSMEDLEQMRKDAYSLS